MHNSRISEDRRCRGADKDHQDILDLAKKASAFDGGILGFVDAADAVEQVTCMEDLPRLLLNESVSKVYPDIAQKAKEVLEKGGGLEEAFPILESLGHLSVHLEGTVKRSKRQVIQIGDSDQVVDTVVMGYRSERRRKQSTIIVGP